MNLETIHDCIIEINNELENVKNKTNNYAQSCKIITDLTIKIDDAFGYDENGFEIFDKFNHFLELNDRFLIKLKHNIPYDNEKYTEENKITICLRLKNFNWMFIDTLYEECDYEDLEKEFFEIEGLMKQYNLTPTIYDMDAEIDEELSFMSVEEKQELFKILKGET